MYSIRRLFCRLATGPDIAANNDRPELHIRSKQASHLYAGEFHKFIITRPNCGPVNIPDSANGNRRRSHDGWVYGR